MAARLTISEIMNSYSASLRAADTMNYHWDIPTPAGETASSGGMSQFLSKTTLEDVAHEDYFLCGAYLNQWANDYPQMSQTIQKIKRDMRVDFIKAFGFDPERPARTLRLIPQ